MSRLNIISCDCGCGETSKESNVFWHEEGDWCTLKYVEGLDDIEDEQLEYHFYSLNCLQRWLNTKRK